MRRPGSRRTQSRERSSRTSSRWRSRATATSRRDAPGRKRSAPPASLTRPHRSTTASHSPASTVPAGTGSTRGASKPPSACRRARPHGPRAHAHQSCRRRGAQRGSVAHLVDDRRHQGLRTAPTAQATTAREIFVGAPCPGGRGRDGSRGRGAILVGSPCAVAAHPTTSSDARSTTTAYPSSSRRQSTMPAASRSPHCCALGMRPASAHTSVGRCARARSRRGPRAGPPQHQTLSGQPDGALTGRSVHGTCRSGARLASGQRGAVAARLDVERHFGQRVVCLLGVQLGAAAGMGSRAMLLILPRSADSPRP